MTGLGSVFPGGRLHGSLITFTVDNANPGQVWVNSDKDLYDMYNDYIIQESSEDSIISPFYDLNSSCEYFTPEQVCDMSRNLCNNNLSLFCINCQSLNAHWDTFNHLIADMSNELFSFDVIGITEIFHVHKDISYKMDGYHPLLYNTRSRENGSRGGVGIYVRDHLTYIDRPDISVFIPHVFESLFIEVQINSKQSIIIGNIYRPNTAPKADLDVFHHTLFELIDTINSQNKKLFLMGDFNIDMMRLKIIIKPMIFLKVFF